MNIVKRNNPIRSSRRTLCENHKLPSVDEFWLFLSISRILTLHKTPKNNRFGIGKIIEEPYIYQKKLVRTLWRHTKWWRHHFFELTSLISRDAWQNSRLWLMVHIFGMENDKGTPHFVAKDQYFHIKSFIISYIEWKTCGHRLIE